MNTGATVVAVWHDEQGQAANETEQGDSLGMGVGHADGGYPNSPSDPDRVHADRAVRCHHRHTLDNRLGDDKPIEWVPMQVR